MIPVILLTFAILANPADIKFRAIGEYGLVGVLSHKVQLGKAGTYFDYVNDGMYGQATDMSGTGCIS